MVKIKVGEASGVVLDYLVAKIEGHQWRCPWMLEKEGLAAWHSYERAWGNPTPAYSSHWTRGGPIIEREIHAFDHMQSKQGRGVTAIILRKNNYDGGWCFGYGPTALIAAMRCYVASKLGDEVEVPEELQNGTSDR